MNDESNKLLEEMYREVASKLGIDTSLPIEKIKGELENIILSEEEIKKFQDVIDNMENYLNKNKNNL